MNGACNGQPCINCRGTTHPYVGYQTRKNTWYALGSKLVISKDIIWGSSYNILTGIVQECIGRMYKYIKGLFSNNSSFLTKNCSNVKSKVSERSWPFVRFPCIWGLRQLAWSKIINLANVFAHRPGNLSRFRKHLSAIPASSKECTFCFRPVVAPGLNSDALCHALVLLASCEMGIFEIDIIIPILSFIPSIHL